MAALPDAPPQPPMTGPMAQPDPQETLDALLNAVKVAAIMGAGSEHMQDIADCSKAALAYAQAWAILHPQLDPAGLPLDHHIQMEQVKGAAQLALEQTRGANALAVAKESARAPTPSRSVQVRRDSTGRASSYDVSG